MDALKKADPMVRIKGIKKDRYKDACYFITDHSRRGSNDEIIERQDS